MDVNFTDRGIEIRDAGKHLKNQGIVMDKIAFPITRKFCDIIGEKKGDILDVGFGTGYSAKCFYDLKVKSYTCIETNPTVYKKALEWSSDKPDVEIILGDWYDVIPKLSKKFDGIFMDTYGDEKEKYNKFESFAKDISNEGCILGIWEYPLVKNISLLNTTRLAVDQEDYPLLLKPVFNVCWTYFFAGEFRKKNFYDKINCIPKKLCQEIIDENVAAGGLKLNKAEAKIDGIVHSREFFMKDLVNNDSLFEILQQKFFSNYEKFNTSNLDFCKFVKYDKGHKHDRHVETDKYLPIIDDEQFKDTILVSLNDDFEGGEVLVYDSWIRGNREAFSNTNTVTGDVVKFNCYQHSQTNKINIGTKYEIFIKVKRKELIQISKYII